MLDAHNQPYRGSNSASRGEHQGIFTRPHRGHNLFQSTCYAIAVLGPGGYAAFGTVRTDPGVKHRINHLLVILAAAHTPIHNFSQGRILLNQPGQQCFHLLVVIYLIEAHIRLQLAGFAKARQHPLSGFLLPRQRTCHRCINLQSYFGQVLAGDICLPLTQRRQLVIVVGTK